MECGRQCSGGRQWAGSIDGRSPCEAALHLLMERREGGRVLRHLSLQPTQLRLRVVQVRGFVGGRREQWEEQV